MTQQKDPLVPEPEPGDEEIDDSKMTLSLMGGVAKPEGLPEPADLDLESMKTGGRMVSQGTLVILLVFAIAAGTLFIMRKTQGDLTGGGVPSDAEVKIKEWFDTRNQHPSGAGADPAVKASIQGLFSNTDSILRIFTNDLTRRQVPIEYVKQNPFALVLPRQAAGTSVSDPSAGDKVRLLEERKALIKHMILQSVMSGGATPVAVIDNSFYKTGQLVGPFTIVAIRDRQVEFVADGQSYFLKMAEDPNAKGPGQH